MRRKKMLLSGSLLLLAGIAAAQAEPKPDNLDDVEVDEQLYQDMMKTGEKKPEPKPDNLSDIPVDEALLKGMMNAPSGSPPKKQQTKSGKQPRPGEPPKAGQPVTAPKSAAESAPPPAAVESSSAKTAPAVKKAERMADQLKKSLDKGEDGTAGGFFGAAAPRPDGGLNPAHPKTSQELIVASMSGFSGAFSALGLKAGKGPSGEAAILRENGQPAGEEELAALQERIAAEPTALIRRPDFFTVLPRERFQALKEAYRTKPGLRETAFKHVEMSAAERDFQRSASCQPLDGGCNPSTVQTAYRKGDLVPPEDLARIQKAVPGEAGDEDGDPASEPEAAAPKGAAYDSSAIDAIYAKLNGLIGSIKETMGIGEGAGKPEGSPVAGAASGAPAEYAFGEAAKPRAGAAPVPAPGSVRPGSVPAGPRAQEETRTKSRPLLRLVALPGLAFLLFAAVRFRRKKPFLQSRPNATL